ncbi:hypothetical protein EG68_01533 [Paragonimus skrjabini miyazakii]|uniref:Uncharacterized protein n=1 Tax=Paragonimus skrjabini miyazakii TaxID=59628 RepID=A0A8S9Z694_9TREM|nr:hypothetical protein EG68_01533 [Paragonimus skrjabini miyazakii]
MSQLNETPKQPRSTASPQPAVKKPIFPKNPTNLLNSHKSTEVLRSAPCDLQARSIDFAIYNQQQSNSSLVSHPRIPVNSASEVVYKIPARSVHNGNSLIPRPQSLVKGHQNRNSETGDNGSTTPVKSIPSDTAPQLRRPNLTVQKTGMNNRLSMSVESFSIHSFSQPIGDQHESDQSSLSALNMQAPFPRTRQLGNEPTRVTIIREEEDDETVNSELSDLDEERRSRPHEAKAGTDKNRSRDVNGSGWINPRPLNVLPSETMKSNSGKELDVPDRPIHYIQHRNGFQQTAYQFMYLDGHSQQKTRSPSRYRTPPQTSPLPSPPSSMIAPQDFRRPEFRSREFVCVQNRPTQARRQTSVDQYKSTPNIHTLDKIPQPQMVSHRPKEFGHHLNSFGHMNGYFMPHKSEHNECVEEDVETDPETFVSSVKFMQSQVPMSCTHIPELYSFPSAPSESIFEPYPPYFDEAKPPRSNLRRRQFVPGLTGQFGFMSPDMDNGGLNAYEKFGSPSDDYLAKSFDHFPTNLVHSRSPTSANRHDQRTTPVNSRSKLISPVKVSFSPTDQEKRPYGFESSRSPGRLTPNRYAGTRDDVTGEQLHHGSNQVTTRAMRSPVAEPDDVRLLVEQPSFQRTESEQSYDFHSQDESNNEMKRISTSPYRRGEVPQTLSLNCLFEPIRRERPRSIAAGMAHAHENLSGLCPVPPYMTHNKSPLQTHFYYQAPPSNCLGEVGWSPNNLEYVSENRK